MNDLCHNLDARPYLNNTIVTWVNKPKLKMLIDEKLSHIDLPANVVPLFLVGNMFYDRNAEKASRDVIRNALLRGDVITIFEAR